MVAQLKKILEVREVPCLTIALNTHRTKPDSLQDAITLKNLMTEARRRLMEEFDRESYEPVLARLEQLTTELDHNYNLESMVIFASASAGELLRLPVAVEERVVVGDRFYIRDVVRAMREDTGYYVLVLSRRQARWIEARNDQVIRECRDNIFPMDNPVIETDPLILTMPQGQDNIIENWFTSVDKAMQQKLNERRLPVIIASEKSNYDHFLKVARNGDVFVGHINRNRDEEEARHIVPDAWMVVRSWLKDRDRSRITELENAVTTGYFFTDFNDIWRAIREGRGRTLFVKRGLIKAAILDDQGIRLLDEPVPAEAELEEDVVDRMIAEALTRGGEIVFLEGDELSAFQDMALTARY